MAGTEITAAEGRATLNRSGEVEIRVQLNGIRKGAFRAGAMATLDQFKTLRSSVAPELQQELFGLMASNPDAALSRMVELAAAQGVTTSSDEVRGFLRAMENEEEFDDIEPDAVALTAIAGGAKGMGRC